MKKRNIMFFCVCVGICCMGCTKSSAKQYEELEKDIDNPSTIGEYRLAIKKSDQKIKEIVQLEAQNGLWYKILGSRYLDKKMYGKALESYKMATQYYPTNQNLYYYIGLCASYMAKSSLDYTGDGIKENKDDYYKMAENAYKTAIHYKDDYARALYALGVLYVFELNEPSKAIDPLSKLLQVETKHIDGMFVLARAYYVSGDGEKAIALYDKIIDESIDKTRKKDAQANKQAVLDTLYGEE